MCESLHFSERRPVLYPSAILSREGGRGEGGWKMRESHSRLSVQPQGWSLRQTYRKDGNFILAAVP